MEAVKRGGGELVSFYAKEPDLVAAFAKRFPQAKLARSEKEILDDNSIQLVASASIANERAPLGIEVMQHGKDFMSDKPGMTTLEQLAEVRRVQAETRRIYSIIYSERLENRATVKAGELVKAGAIGQGRPDDRPGPASHRRRRPARPGSSRRSSTAGSSATSPRTSSTSSCSSPDRTRRRSSPRRWATSPIRSIPGSRTSAT